MVLRSSHEPFFPTNSLQALVDNTPCILQQSVSYSWGMTVVSGEGGMSHSRPWVVYMTQRNCYLGYLSFLSNSLDFGGCGGDVAYP